MFTQSRSSVMLMCSDNGRWINSFSSSELSPRPPDDLFFSLVILTIFDAIAHLIVQICHWIDSKAHFILLWERVKFTQRLSQLTIIPMRFVKINCSCVISFHNLDLSGYLCIELSANNGSLMNFSVYQGSTIFSLINWLEPLKWLPEDDAIICTQPWRTA